MAKLHSGSDEYWKIKEHAERLYRKKMDARSSDERRDWADRCHDLIDGLREKYGYDDEMVKSLNDWYDVDRD